MASQIDSYINMIEQNGFVPNQNTTNSPTNKRTIPDLNSLMGKRTPPNANLVLHLLAQHGFVPNQNKSSPAVTTRAIDNLGPSLEKRTIPDINLVISRLEAHGFFPSSGNNTEPNVKKRQSASDINSVITQLEAHGYNPETWGLDPNDFIQGSSRNLIHLFTPAPDSMNIATTAATNSTLPTETTALCPQDNNTIYTTGSSTYEIFCGFDFPGNDLPAVHTETLALCLSACSTYAPNQNVADGAPCVAASWGEGNVGGNCYLKYNITGVNNNDGGLQAGRNTVSSPM